MLELMILSSTIAILYLTKIYGVEAWPYAWNFPLYLPEERAVSLQFNPSPELDLE